MTRSSAVAGGKKAKSNGKRFEDMIEVACDLYTQKGIARISKTPEPMKIIGKQTRGGFPAVFVKQAQPDFQGTLKGGTSIMFEAKHTASTNIRFDRLTNEQVKEFQWHDELGGICFIFITFNFDSYYTVMWKDWLELKRRTNKLSANKKDLEPYKIDFSNDLDFLKGVRL